MPFVLKGRKQYLMRKSTLRAVCCPLGNSAAPDFEAFRCHSRESLMQVSGTRLCQPANPASPACTDSAVSVPSLASWCVENRRLRAPCNRPCSSTTSSSAVQRRGKSPLLLLLARHHRLSSCRSLTLSAQCARMSGEHWRNESEICSMIRLDRRWSTR